VNCPKQKTLIVCSEGHEIELFDLLSQLILERIEDGTLRKTDALLLLNRIEHLYLKVHEYTIEEDNWLY
jgi:hypothetical protein